MKNFAAYLFIAFCFFGLFASNAFAEEEKTEDKLQSYKQQINDLEKKINEQNDLIRDLRKDYNEAKFKFDKAVDEQNESKAEFNQKVNEITKRANDLASKYNSCTKSLAEKDALIEAYKNNNLEFVLRSFTNNFIRPLVLRIMEIIVDVYHCIIRTFNAFIVYLDQFSYIHTLFDAFENFYKDYLKSYVDAYMPTIQKYKKLFLDELANGISFIGAQYSLVCENIKHFLHTNEFTKKNADLIFDILLSIFIFLSVLSLGHIALTILYHFVAFPFTVLNYFFGPAKPKEQVTEY